MRTTQLFIDGAWVDATSEDTLEVVNPADASPLATMAIASDADIEAAVAAARRAFDSGPWPRMTGYERRKILLAFARELQDAAFDIGAVETDDMGMPLPFTPPAVMVAADHLEYFAGWADKIGGHVIPTPVPGALDYTIRHPVGVVAALVPWNSPTYLSIAKIAPALAAGCTIVLKPSERAPLAPLEIARAAERAGLPAGVLNVITGTGAHAGTALVEHPGIDKVSFTGGTEIGRQIAARAGAQFKRCSLELGGKSANIVFADANLDAAVIGAAMGFLMNTGQQCIAGSRLLIERPVYDEVLERVAATASAFVVGNPRTPGTQMGPLISAEHLQRVLGYVDTASKAGEVRLGGERLGGDLANGFFIGPTVVADVDTDSSLWREEVFGPVIAARPFDTREEAVAMANDSTFGLAGGVWTTNLNTAHTVAGAIRTGTVWVNSYLTMVPGAPFGGFKDSGIGREGGWAAIEDATELTNVLVAVQP